MPIPSTPSIMPNVLGYAADTVQIPETTPTGQGIPSFRDLFPFITQVDPDAGGVMVERAWMNALFNLLGQHAFFQQSGCVYPWQATLDYIAGCHVMGSNGIEYMAQQSSGPDVPGVGAKNPTTDTGVYWKAFVAGGGRIPGEVVPFYNVKLGGPPIATPSSGGSPSPIRAGSSATAAVMGWAVPCSTCAESSSWVRMVLMTQGRREARAAPPPPSPSIIQKPV